MINFNINFKLLYIFRDVFRKTKDEQDNCLIHYLAQKCFNSMINTKEKYVKKSDSNIPGYCGMAPIHFAARYGTNFKDTEKTMKTMMDFMDDPHQEDEFGNTVLHYAILNSEDIRYDKMTSNVFPLIVKYNFAQEWPG